MRSSRQRNSCAADRLPGLPTAGIRHHHGPCHVDAVDFHMERTTLPGRGHPRTERVFSRPGCQHPVRQPFPAAHPAERESTSDVRRHRDIHIRLPILSAGVASRQIVIGHAFTAFVESLRFDDARNRRGCAPERQRRGPGQYANVGRGRCAGGAVCVGGDGSHGIAADRCIGPREFVWRRRIDTDERGACVERHLGDGALPIERRRAERDTRRG